MEVFYMEVLYMEVFYMEVFYKEVLYLEVLYREVLYIEVLLYCIKNTPIIMALLIPKSVHAWRDRIMNDHGFFNTPPPHTINNRSWLPCVISTMG